MSFIKPVIGGGIGAAATAITDVNIETDLTVGGYIPEGITTAVSDFSQWASNALSAIPGAETVMSSGVGQFVGDAASSIAPYAPILAPMLGGKLSYDVMGKFTDKQWLKVFASVLGGTATYAAGTAAAPYVLAALSIKYALPKIGGPLVATTKHAWEGVKHVGSGLKNTAEGISGLPMTIVNSVKNTKSIFGVEGIFSAEPTPFTFSK